MGEEEGEERCLNWAGAHLYCALAEVTTYQSKQPISKFLLGECGIFSPCCIASRKRRKKKVLDMCWFAQAAIEPVACSLTS